MIFVNTLGTALITAGDVRVTPASARKFAMLLYLSAESGRRVPRAFLQELLFPDSDQTKAKHSIRELLYQVRQNVTGLISDPTGVELSSECVRLDYSTLGGSGKIAIEQLKAAEGGLLPGYDPAHSEAFNEWLDAFRARTAIGLSRVLVRETTLAKSAGDWSRTELAARACLAMDPLNEEATLSLAEMLAIGGAKRQAVQLLDDYLGDIKTSERDLKLPAAVLRRRIGERLPSTYGETASGTFVGREDEMRMLASEFRRVQTGTARCVVLQGEPGIGKSRLAAEFSTWALLEGASVRRGSLQPHDAERPMSVFVDLVPELIKLPGALGCSPESMDTLTRLTRLDSTTARPGSADSSVEPAEAVAWRITRAIVDLIDAVTAEAPLILVIDDAQWLDELSYRTMSSLLAKAGSRGVMFVMTSRNADQGWHAAHGLGDAGVMTIAPLSDASAAAIVEQSFDQREFEDDEARDWVVAAGAGNPFYLGCILTHLEQHGQPFTLPATITTLADQRLTGLSSNAATVLLSCVLLARYSTMDRLAATVELPSFAMFDAVRELEGRRLVAQTDSLIHPSHWLIVEAVHRAFAGIATRFIHRRIATLLEAEAHETKSSATLWDCGEHWLAAGELDAAVSRMRDCARHSVAIGDTRGAVELLLRAASHAPLSTKLALVQEGIRVAAKSRELDLVLRGAVLLRETGIAAAHDDIEMAELDALSGWLGDVATSSARLRRCIVDRDASQQHRIEAGLSLMITCDQHADRAGADFVIDELASLLAAAPVGSDISSKMLLMVYHASFGSIEQAVPLAEDLLAGVVNASADVQTDIYRKVGITLWRAGNVTASLSALEKGYDCARLNRMRRSEFTIAIVLANFSLDAGRREGSDRWTRISEELANEFPSFRDAVSYIINGCDRAAASHDPADLIHWHGLAVRSQKQESPEILQRWVYAIGVMIDLTKGNVVPGRSSIGRLTQHHAAGDNGDIEDLEIAVALKVARQSDRSEYGRSLLEEYLGRCRRSRSPLSAALQSAIISSGLESVVHAMRGQHEVSA
jgi:DNA-binding SARP family transcriptional activator